MGMSMNVTMMQNNNRGLRHGGVSCREHLLTGGWSFSRSVTSTWCESPNCLEFGFILWMLKCYNVFDERVVSVIIMIIGQCLSLSRDCLRFAFMEVLQNELDKIHHLWNTDKIAKARTGNRVCGIPDKLFYNPEVQGMSYSA